MHFIHRYRTIEDWSSNVCWYGVCRVCGKRMFKRVGLGPRDDPWVKTGKRSSGLPPMSIPVGDAMRPEVV